MKVDLHIHTSASDGDFSIEQLANRLFELNVDYVSFTDHEHLTSCDKISCSYTTINGIELYADYCGTEVHILGYGIKNQTVLEGFIKDKHRIRKNNYLKLLYMLSKRNIRIPSTFFEEEKGDIESLITYILRSSSACNRQEAYQYYMEDILKKYPLNVKTPYKEAIDILKMSGGIAILAHPLRSLKKTEFESCICEMKDYGLDGVESPYFTNSLIDDFACDIFVRKLVITFGSDFHGSRKNQDLNDLVAINVNDEYIEPFLGLL